jgi:DNA polymerase alpha subunit p180 N terminal
MDRRKKAAALQAFKEGRGGRLDDYQVPDEEDVYEVLDESEYQKLVESRRQREDFVVDDGACTLGVVPLVVEPLVEELI